MHAGPGLLALTGVITKDMRDTSDGLPHLTPGKDGFKAGVSLTLYPMIDSGLASRQSNDQEPSP